MANSCRSDWFKSISNHFPENAIYIDFRVPSMCLEIRIWNLLELHDRENNN